MKSIGFQSSQTIYQNNMFVGIYRITSDILLIPILIFFIIRLIFSKEKLSSILEKFSFLKFFFETPNKRKAILRERKNS